MSSNSCVLAVYENNLAQCVCVCVCHCVFDLLINVCLRYDVSPCHEVGVYARRGHFPLKGRHTGMVFLYA